ncbi:MAG: OsmC family protein, partial [Solirubrobacterales bacterium]
MSTPATTYEVQARIVHPGVSEIQAKQERISFDSSPQMGDELPGPAELLCSAFAACLLKNVERFSEMLPFKQQGASVHVRAERQQEPPRFTTISYELRIVTDEPEE